MLDLSGPIGTSGTPMYYAAQVAVSEINAAGGVLGRPTRTINYDTQSTIQLYSQYAQELALKDKVAWSRAASPPPRAKPSGRCSTAYKILYFYNVLYEGGVCDRDIFCTGTTPAQTVNKLVAYAPEDLGQERLHRRRRLQLRPDHRQVDDQIHPRRRRQGAVATEFFPLDVTNFSATISKIQEAKPDIVLSALVGSNHTGFYRQWAAVGHEGQDPDRLDHVRSGQRTGDDGGQGKRRHRHRLWLFRGTEDARRTRRSSRRSRIGSAQNIPYMGELTAVNYEGYFLWAAGVKKAGTLDRLKVIKALETGIEIDGPTGHVKIDPPTHHAIRNAYLGKAENKTWRRVRQSIPNQPPSDTAAVCDLIKDPNTDKQFVIDIKT